VLAATACAKVCPVVAAASVVVVVVAKVVAVDRRE